MNKTELTNRAKERAEERGYKEGFSTSLLNDLIKDGLVPEGKRTANQGKKPSYNYDRKCYRRLLQVLRLQALGIIRRDALLLQLFLRGYGIKPFFVKDALRKEYRKACNRLNREARSGYLDNNRVLPPKHKESVLRSLGRPDGRLVDAALALQDDSLIHFVREAKQKPLSKTSYSAQALSAALVTGDMKPPFEGKLDGLLNIEQNRTRKVPDRKKSKNVDAIEDLFEAATDVDYVEARIWFWAMIRGGLGLGADLISPFSEITKREVAVGAVEYTVPTIPEFTAFLFAQSLKDVYHSDSDQNKYSNTALSPKELTNLGFEICGVLKAFLFPGSWKTTAT